LALVTAATHESKASGLFSHWRCRPACDSAPFAYGEGPPEEFSGTTYWLRTPEQERRVVASLYNRYCIRCHGIDGRGVWDIPDVPDLTNARWQASRSDGQLARITLEGRGAVMPPFRGTLTLEEAWAMARYLRTFVPGTEVSRPDYGQPEKPSSVPQPAPKKLEAGRH
jgi:mono/diheme cytochrome c family protein